MPPRPETSRSRDQRNLRPSTGVLADGCLSQLHNTYAYILKDKLKGQTRIPRGLQHISQQYLTGLYDGKVGLWVKLRTLPGTDCSPLSTEDAFQDPRGARNHGPCRPCTCTYRVLSYTHICMIKFTLSIRHSQRLTIMTDNKIVITVYCNKSYVNGCGAMIKQSQDYVSTSPAVLPQSI